MTSEHARRIVDGAQLGRAKRGYDLVLGWAAIVPILVGATAVWFAPTSIAMLLERLVVLWSGVLLTFFAGVRRGLSFSELGGAETSELVSMLWLFVLGFLTVVVQSSELAIIGFASVGVLDVLAARRAQAPAYFGRFRPAQMALAVIGLGLISLR